MVYFLETEGNSRCALEGEQPEVFTQKRFIDLIKDTHSTKNDYYLARVKCLSKEEENKSIIGEKFNMIFYGKADESLTNNGVFYCYDARQLCKYLFQMVIDSSGRTIAIKNYRDPIYKRRISNICFFKLAYDSETPLKAEYAGNAEDFMGSNHFRRKIFHKEDPLDALSVSLEGREGKSRR